MGALIGLAVSGVSRLLGKHLVANHLAGAGIGTAQSVVEGFGMRFFFGFGLAFYWLNPDFRAGADACIAAVFAAIKGGS